MNHAFYVVLRLVPDTARNEPVNVGILAWSNDHVIVRLDDTALARALQMAPNWSNDALSGLEQHIRSCSQNGWPSNEDEARQALAAKLHSPLVTTAPMRIFSREEADPVAELERTVEQLSTRLVHVRRRSSPHLVPLLKPIHNQIGHFIESKKVEVGRKFKETHSGRTRSVDFFANSSVNVALDAVSVRNNAQEESIFKETDHLVTKINDIRNGNQTINDFLVYVPVDQRPFLDKWSNEIAKVLSTSCDCKVLTDYASAGKEFSALIESQIAAD